MLRFPLAALLAALPLSATAPPQPQFPLGDKTLVAWVSLDNLTQKGGSALTLEADTEEFDGLVFGELSAAKWMAGSDGFRRSHKDQAKWPAETNKPGEYVQVAAVYKGQQVALFRDGEEFARYEVPGQKKFEKTSHVLMGLRHLSAPGNCLAGKIDDARIYQGALDAASLAKLKPNAKGGLEPLAWWDFEDGTAADKQKAFPAAKLEGGAKVVDGKLVLPGGRSYLAAGVSLPRTRQTEQWPTWHVTALPHEGVGLPYDANGCIFWKGRYHLMYIYQDPKLPHGGHCWGHASSTDLVNWTFHPPCLVPQKGDPDVGIFSGNAFLDKDGKPCLCWFGVNAGVCVATAEDDMLIHWKKHPKNAIIPMPKKGEADFGKYKVWDPNLWLEGDTYYCLLGGNELPNKKDTLFLCKSKELGGPWEKLHPFYEHPDLGWTGPNEDCSCPDFFKMGDKHVLMCISHKVGARAYIGTFKGDKFLPEQHVRMNWPGGTFFAPESLEAKDGRRIFWAWVTDPRHMRTQRATGSGFQSMPRVLALAKDHTARITPAKELEALRGERTEIPAQEVKGEAVLGVKGDSMEVRLTIDPGSAEKVAVKVRCSADGSEETAIIYDPAKKGLTVDMSKSSTRKDITYTAGPIEGYGGGKDARTSFTAPLELPKGEPLVLRIFLDKSMLEVFANDRQCVTQLIFPDKPDAVGVKVSATGGTAKLLGGEAWPLKAAAFVDEKYTAKK